MSIVGVLGAYTGWEAIERSIQAWVKNGSTLDDAKIIWDYQGGQRPKAPYIELSLSEIGTVGHDWKIYDDAPDPVAGEELRVRARGMRTAVLTLIATGIPSAGQTAGPLLASVVDSLELYVADLDTAGIGIGNVDRVQVVPGNRAGILEPRARCTVGLHLMSEVEARQTYIERFQLTITPKNPAGTTLASVEVWVPDEP